MKMFPGMEEDPRYYDLVEYVETTWHLLEERVRLGAAIKWPKIARMMEKKKSIASSNTSNWSYDEFG